MITNPFFPFGELDVSKFDLTKMLGAAKVPGLDMQALMATQSKNIDALTQANKMVIEGMQAVAKRQMEILTQTMTEATRAASTLSLTASPQDKMQLQMDVTKRAFEQALANMRALADMVQQSNRNAVDVIGKRVADSMDEVKDLVKK